MKRCTPDEAMLVAAAKEIKDGDRIIVGQGLGIVAGVLAKVYHQRDVVLLTEAGIVDFNPYRAPFHIADPTCTRGYAYNCDLVDVFSTIAFRGFADVCFLGVAQIDKFGNVNSTVIGDYHKPSMRLSGSGGAPEFLAYSHRSILTMRGGRFVDRCDYVTSPGYLEGGDARYRAGFPPDSGPGVLISTKGVFRFHPETKEMYLDAVFPYSSVEEVKKDIPWDLQVAPDLKQVELPTEGEIDFIRDFDPMVSVGRRVSYDMFAKAMKTFLTAQKHEQAKEQPKAGGGEVAAWFASVPGRFDPERAPGLAAVFCFKIAGPGGGEWTASIAEGKCTVSEGLSDQASLTISAQDNDWLDIIRGKLDSVMAFTQGKLGLTGDMALAMKLGNLFLKK